MERFEPRARRWPLAAAALPFLLLLLGGLLFPASGRDDFYITCWPARTLIESGRVLNYNGEAVEQSSSLSQVLLLAGLGGSTGLEIPTLGRLSSVLGAVACLLALALLGRAWRRDRPVGWTAALLCAGSTQFSYWAYGGLESTLAAALAVVWVELCARWCEGESRPASGGVLLAGVASALALVRPEMPLVMLLVLLALGIWVRLDGQRLPRSAPVLALLHLIGIAFVLTLRRMGTGSWIPQPVRAKAEGFSWEAFRRGLDYWTANLSDGRLVGPLLSLLLLGLFVQLLRRAHERDAPVRWKLCLLFPLGYGSFVLFAGGDWMEGGRLLVPLAPFLALCTADLLWRLRSRWIPFVLAALVALECLAMVELAATRSTSIPVWDRASGPEELWKEAEGEWSLSAWGRKNRIHLRDLPTLARLGRVLESLQQPGRRLRVLSGQMGFAAYHLARRFGDRVQLVDRFGLTGTELTECPALRRRRRGSMGLVLGYGFLLRALGRLERECDLRRPDVIFDLGAGGDLASVLRPAGYEIVYEQLGFVRSDSESLPGLPVPAHQFIAVSREHLDRLGEDWPVEVEFADAP